MVRRRAIGPLPIGHLEPVQIVQPCAADDSYRCLVLVCQNPTPLRNHSRVGHRDPQARIRENTIVRILSVAERGGDGYCRDGGTVDAAGLNPAALKTAVGSNPNSRHHQITHPCSVKLGFNSASARPTGSITCPMSTNAMSHTPKSSKISELKQL